MTSNKLERLLHLVGSVESRMMHGLANHKFNLQGYCQGISQMLELFKFYHWIAIRHYI